MSNTTITSKIDEQCNNINQLANDVHALNIQWWMDIHTGERKKRNKGEQLMLVVTELAEAMEGVRKGVQDDHLPTRSMEEVEMADAVIRILDYCGGHGIDLGGAIKEKLAYNAKRADHKIENRIKEGGKSC